MDSSVGAPNMSLDLKRDSGDIVLIPKQYRTQSSVVSNTSKEKDQMVEKLSVFL